MRLLIEYVSGKRIVEYDVRKLDTAYGRVEYVKAGVSVSLPADQIRTLRVEPDADIRGL